jgi:hypothetical protein
MYLRANEAPPGTRFAVLRGNRGGREELGGKDLTLLIA